MERKHEGSQGATGRRSGLALVTALILAVVLSSLIAAALLYSQSHFTLAFANARSEAALLLAEGGVNDELQYIANHLNATDPTQLSSPPVVGVGETEVYPPDGAIVKGRKGGVDGYPNRAFWVYSSNDQAGTTPWDGVTQTFWITATAKVEGSWRRVRVQAKPVSIFSLHAIFALASYSNDSNAIALSAASVTVVGTGGTNGTISNSSSSLIVSNAINANTAQQPSGQFTSANLASGGVVYTRPTPVVYPSVATVLKRLANRPADTDAQIWAWLSNPANNRNRTGIYTYADRAASSAIASSNCVAFNPNMNALTGNTWSNAGYRPGSYQAISRVSISNVRTVSGQIRVTTATKHNLSTGQSVTILGVLGYVAANGTWRVTRVNNTELTLNGSVGSGTYTSGGSVYANEVKTLIFTPGDYYFTDIDLPYDYRTQLVIDPMAYSTGGVPGQVRFWIYDPSGNSNDSVSLPIAATMAAGQSNPDPDMFRIYFSKDGKVFELERPSNPIVLNETTHALVDLTGDFNVFGGVYAVTKLPGETSNLNGTQVSFRGATGTTGGQIRLIGCLLADKLRFQGPCTVVYQKPDIPGDPHAGAGVVGGYSDGGM